MHQEFSCVQCYAIAINGLAEQIMCVRASKCIPRSPPSPSVLFLSWKTLSESLSRSNPDFIFFHLILRVQHTWKSCMTLH